jgi:hypothetical protein
LQLLPDEPLDDADVVAAAAALEVDPPELLLLLLELPQPTATSAVSAAATNVRRTFIACYSSSGVGADLLW